MSRSFRKKGDIAFSPDIPLDESCYREASAADMLVLIIGGRYGTERSESREDLPHSFFDRYDSITKEEYKSALSNNIPVWILVDAQVYAEYQTFQKNKSSRGIVYAHVDSINIFLLLEEIMLQRRNNPLFTFSRYTEIEDWLREQWAGIFRDLLKRTAQSQQLASLSTQVFQLSEINKTLKTYLENLMRSVSPEKYEQVIETESSRLSELERITNLKDNGFIGYLGMSDIPIDIAAKIIQESNGLEEFKEKIQKSVKSEKELRRLDLDDTLETRGAQEDLNECRAILGKPPFVFLRDSPRSSRPRRVSPNA
jgi:hypothetical protein